MRSDKNLGSRFRKSKSWKQDADLQSSSLVDSLSSLRQVDSENGSTVDSLSGGERNPTYLNVGGKSYADITLVSGADSAQDGRAFVYWDFNKDGWLDLAVVNANAPMLQIFENKLHRHFPDSGYVFVQFEGAQRSPTPTESNSTRDGYGCIVRAEVDGKLLRAEHRCGSGFAAQNSALVHFGLGSASMIDTLTVRWPSGELQKIEEVPPGSLIVCREHQPLEKRDYITVFP